jgi:hypothetical protein
MGIRLRLAWVRAAGILSSGMFAACGYFGDGYSYPSLNSAKLIGCWVNIDPGPSSPCMETCFSASGIVFEHTNDGPGENGEVYFQEMAGTYAKTDRNTLTMRARFGNNVEKPDTASDKFDVDYTIRQDTLYSISVMGGNLSPYVRADSARTCGPHWQIFPKPEGWDLD